MADCFVTDRDYRRYFDGEAVPVDDAPVWSGVERRVGVADRRANAHDRRWERAKGRRFRFDRRRRTS